MGESTTIRADMAQPSTSTSAVHMGHQDEPWGEVTVALVFPYHLAWRRRPLCRDWRPMRLRSGDNPSREVEVPREEEGRLGVKRRAWDPLSLNPAEGETSRMTIRDTAYQHWFDPAKYFHSDHLAARVLTTSALGSEDDSTQYEAWVPGDDDAAAEGRALPRRLYDVYSDFVLDRDPHASQRLEVLAAERHEFLPVWARDGSGEGGAVTAAPASPDDPGCGFAVLHLKAVGFTSDELTRLSEYISKPSWWRSPGEEARGLAVDITRMLHGMGLHVQASRGGYTDSCVRNGELRCSGADAASFEPADCEVRISGWQDQRLRAAFLPRDRKVPTLVYQTGCLGDALALPDPSAPPARLAKSANKVLGLWCLPIDDVCRPSPYTLFHLGTSDNWSEEEKWSYQLAAGHRLSGTYALPDDTREEALSGTIHALGSDIRVCPTGLAVLLDPALRTSHEDFRAYKQEAAAEGRRLADFRVDSYVSEPVVRSVVHGRFVELTMLALRQRFLLADHVQELARLHESTSARVAARADSATAAIELEQRFQWFVNQRWFEDVPGRSEGTRVLTTLQDQWGLSAELDRIREEQEGIFRIQTFRHRQRQTAEQRAAEDQRRQARESAEAEAQRRHRRRTRTRETFETLAAIFAPPALIFSALAVVAEPSIWLGLVGVAVSAVAVVATFAWLRRVAQRQVDDVEPHGVGARAADPDQSD